MINQTNDLRFQKQLCSFWIFTLFSKNLAFNFKIKFNKRVFIKFILEHVSKDFIKINNLSKPNFITNVKLKINGQLKSSRRGGKHYFVENSRKRTENNSCFTNIQNTFIVDINTCIQIEISICLINTNCLSINWSDSILSCAM